MDKRDLSGTFRDRLNVLVARSGGSRSAFAHAVGVDRSALSQLLSGTVTRLPRTETLVSIAEAHKVSLDWLLGLSQDEGLTGEIRPSLELEQAPDEADRALLSKWHAEAAGTKIRYVPAGIPDLLRSPALIDYESAISCRSPTAQSDDAQSKLLSSRQPDTDMEVCMPRHTLEIFARGLGIWTGLSPSARRAQLNHMAALLDELYPSLRLYLYDGKARFSAPYTVFGSQRATLYVGDMYLVLNATESVRTLTRHFDNLIRAAEINAHEVATHARGLRMLIAD
ncbi:helix-turn-helix transcriptional regulator [Mesorhizobium sp. RP14(2022)]|uniref:Helix-turn-helix transcriptional regulator n=1 Tax=Mesorhizobium liriopis TaxID=2953882 RepID=A0ABT1C5J3_9HYPH|nr:helix-turn-helix transcriptional regulator [Mesorhizobium liriopis]MCO6050099.1 helix-turn-helix transcriptional regulator [Mesorhizobium liriopis]